MEAGITTDPAYLMNLTSSAAVTTAENDLYLAVKGWMMSSAARDLISQRPRYSTMQNQQLPQHRLC